MKRPTILDGFDYRRFAIRTEQPTLPRAREAAALLHILRRPGGVANLVGIGGVGKTTLLRHLLSTPAIDAVGHIARGLYDDGPSDARRPGLGFVQAINDIVPRLDQRNHNVIFADDADMIEHGAIVEGLMRLSASGASFAIVFASRLALSLGEQVVLGPMDEEEVRQLVENAWGRTVDLAAVRHVLSQTDGNPQLTELLAERGPERGANQPRQLDELLSPMDVPGLVDSAGRPLRKGSAGSRKIITDVRSVSADLIDYLAADPERVHSLAPRTFEELVAELLDRQGYEVTLTPQTRDGGKDMYAARKDGLGSFLYIVEVKKYAPHRAVGVGLVRSLHGQARQERVTAAMMMTTSRFSADARSYAARIQYQIALRDFVDLKDWLARYRS